METTQPTAADQAASAKEAAQNMLDLAGFGTLCGIRRVVAKVVTRHGAAGKFQAVEIAICGYGRGMRLGRSREDKAIRAAIAAASAEVDAPYFLEIAA